MTDTYTQGPRAAEFILSEANGSRSRENGTVAQGQNLAAGQVVMMSAGKLVAHDGTLDGNDDVVTAAAGVLIHNVDASSTGQNADVAAAYVARDAEVNGNLLVFPTESSDGGERVAVVASLETLGIRVRDEITA